jgi:hypothetical protein
MFWDTLYFTFERDKFVNFFNYSVGNFVPLSSYGYSLVHIRFQFPFIYTE